jgi:hypothetical protein
MRYLVMTGVPRRRLYATRVLGTAISTLLCCLPAVVLMIVAAYALRHSAFNDPTLSDDLAAMWAYRQSARLRAGERGRRLAPAFQRAAIGVSLGLSLGGASPRPGRLRQRELAATSCPPPPTSRRNSTATRTSRWPRRSRQS